jgi:DNA modification methylase
VQHIELLHGDCLEVLKQGPDNSVDSVVTDPPAGISFMGKDWDSDKGGSKEWIAWLTEVSKEMLRVLKPGGHGLVWAIPRTSHWTATALEDAGFEIRDVVTHLFGTGFPKSLDISKAIDKAAGAEREIVGLSTIGGGGASNKKGYATDGEQGSGGSYLQASDGKNGLPITAPATPEAKQWQGFGTALKPASEHWILVRKPLSEKTVAANVLMWGTGGINIDGCRIGTDVISTHGGGDKMSGMKGNGNSGVGEYKTHTGRFPANLVLDEAAAAMLDAQSGHLAGRGSTLKKVEKTGNENVFGKYDKRVPQLQENRGGGASRFFYVAKASTAEKNLGLEDATETTVDDGRNKPIDNPFLRGETARKNTHPTVKSIKLMEYLITLVTPPGGTVLDPFMGSGSTGMAAKGLGFSFIGIEREQEYLNIAERRIASISINQNNTKVVNE